MRTRAIPSGFAPTSHFSRHLRAGLMNAAAIAAGFWWLFGPLPPKKLVLTHQKATISYLALRGAEAPLFHGTFSRAVTPGELETGRIELQVLPDRD